MTISLAVPTFGEEEIQAAVDVLRSTNVTSGKKVKEFEGHFGCNAVMCNSGSSANLLAIAALTNPVTSDHLKRGDEVIVSALSWATTVWPLIQHGLVPVIVDIDPETLNMDINAMAAALGPKTRAIMPVHVYGNPCDMDAIMAIATKHDLRVIEDCCESLSATFNGKPVGSFGDFGTFSFYFSHHITTLEGGLCVARGRGDADLLRILRAHGWTRDMDDPSYYLGKYPDIDPRFLFVNLGYNLRATELQAAIGLVQLGKLDGFIEARRSTAERLTEVFSKYDHLFTLQKELDHGRSSWFGFPVTVHEDAPFLASSLRIWFDARGIETRSMICGNIAEQPALKMYPHRVPAPLPNADRVMKYGFSLPCHQDMKKEDCELIASALDRFIRERESC